MKTLEIWWTREGAAKGIEALTQAYESGWDCEYPVSWSQCGNYFTTLKMAGEGHFILGFTG